METFDSEASAITPVRDGERAQDIIRNKRGEAEGEVTVADHPDDRHAVMFACVVVNRDAAVDDADQQEVRQRREAEKYTEASVRTYVYYDYCC